MPLSTARGAAFMEHSSRTAVQPVAPPPQVSPPTRSPPKVHAAPQGPAAGAPGPSGPGAPPTNRLAEMSLDRGQVIQRHGTGGDP